MVDLSLPVFRAPAKKKVEKKIRKKESPLPLRESRRLRNMTAKKEEEVKKEVEEEEDDKDDTELIDNRLLGEDA